MRLFDEQEVFLDNKVKEIIVNKNDDRPRLLEEFHGDLKMLHSAGYDVRKFYRGYHQMVKEYFPKPEDTKETNG